MKQLVVCYIKTTTVFNREREECDVWKMSMVKLNLSAHGTIEN